MDTIKHTNPKGEKKHSFPVKNVRESPIKSDGPMTTSIVVHAEETTARSFTVPLYPAKCSFFRLGLPKEQSYRSYIPISYHEMTVIGRIFRGNHSTDFLECKFPEPIRGQFEYPCAFTFERKGENAYKMTTTKDRKAENSTQKSPVRQQKKAAPKMDSGAPSVNRAFPSLKNKKE